MKPLFTDKSPFQNPSKIKEKADFVFGDLIPVSIILLGVRVTWAA
jgi:hypothetical protein